MVSKQEIRDWLKLHKLKYSWLAEQLNVSLPTVNAWLSTRDIPLKHLVRIDDLMKNDSEEEVLSGDLKLYVEVSADVQNSLERMALECGLTLSEFISQALERIGSDPQISRQFNQLLCGRNASKAEDFIISSLRAAESTGGYAP